MKVKGLFKKVIAVATVVSVMIFSTIGVYAKYSDSTSDYAYAGDTRFLYTLKMDEFSAYAYLDSDDEAELTLNGYVLFSAYYDNEKYSFSAADQLGYSIGAGRQTPFLTRYSYCWFRNWKYIYKCELNTLVLIGLITFAVRRWYYVWEKEKNYKCCNNKFNSNCYGNDYINNKRK